MEFLTFEIKSKNAHFKKFCSNKTALTYHIPPKSVIAGMLASILEMERDSYYDLFSHDNLKVAVEILQPAKTFLETLNYRFDKGITQVVKQQLIPLKKGQKEIVYKIYIYHTDKEILNKLLEKLKDNDFGYGVYLGTENNIAFINNAKIEKAELLEEASCTLSTSILEENIIEIGDDNDNIISDLMPMGFKIEINKRIPTIKKNVIYSLTEEGIKGRFKNIIKLDNKYISFN